jgi:hypothetical protein
MRFNCDQIELMKIIESYFILIPCFIVFVIKRYITKKNETDEK